VSKLRRIPLKFTEAAQFVALHHRHHTPPVGHKFSIGAALDAAIIGVIIVGRPVSRHRDDGMTLEVTRCCTVGDKNACSFLYGAAARAAFAMGYQRIGTYTLKSENSSSLRGAGWRLLGEAGGGSWNCQSRPRDDKAPTETKLLWELAV